MIKFDFILTYKTQIKAPKPLELMFCEFHDVTKPEKKLILLTLADLTNNQQTV